jgi:hypothetical protein
VPNIVLFSLITLKKYKSSRFNFYFIHQLYQRFNPTSQLAQAECAQNAKKGVDRIRRAIRKIVIPDGRLLNEC